MGIANPTQANSSLRYSGARPHPRARGPWRGTDEIAVHGTTHVWELNDGEIKEYDITPEELGIARHELAELEGGDGAENAALIRKVFAGEGKPAHYDAIVATAGAMFYLCGKAESIAAGVAHAKEVIDSGQVAQWLRTHEEANYG